MKKATGMPRIARITASLLVLAFVVMACAVPPVFSQIATPSASMTKTDASMTTQTVMEGRSWTEETLIPWTLYAPQGTVNVRECPSSSCSAVGYLVPRASVYALCLDGQPWCIVESGYVLKACLLGSCKAK